MPIDTELDSLVAATNTLFSSVETQRVNLTNSVTAIQAQAALTLTNTNAVASVNTTAQAAVISAADSAARAAQANEQANFVLRSSVAPNEVLPELGRFFHTGSIVRAIIYDTSKDSDGGLWRKRTSHTSWFNETIYGTWGGQAANNAAGWTACGSVTGGYYQNTTDGKFYAPTSSSAQTEVFRGNAREFPEVVAIVAELYKVVIYDLTQPNAPMWMVFATTSASDFMLRVNNSITTVACFNATLIIGATKSDSNPVWSPLVDFVKDSVDLLSASGDTLSTRAGVCNVAVRNTTLVYGKGSPTWRGLVNSKVNDVAITALPNAPIDPATGLPVPVIAVATAGGVTVLKHDGTAVNSLNTQHASYIALYKNGAVTWSINAGDQIFNAAYPQSASFGAARYAAAINPKLSGAQASKRINTMGSNLATLTPVTAYEPVRENLSATTLGMFASIAHNYSTGWQVGDSKLAILNEVNPESVSADSLIVGDSATFTNSVGAWRIPSTGGEWRQGSVTAVGGKLSINNPAAVTVTSATWSGGVVTMTTATPHGYQTGETTFASGFTPNAYAKPGQNQGFISSMTVTSATTFTYPLAADPGPCTVLGTISTGAIAELPIATTQGACYRLTYTADQTAYITVGNSANQGSNGSLLGQTTTPSGACVYEFVATGANSFINVYKGQTPSTSVTFDNFACVRVAQSRAFNAKSFVVNGTLNKVPVATGAQLTAYTGFSPTNYLEQPYNTDLNFGTGDFCVMGWANSPAASFQGYFHRTALKQSTADTGICIFVTGGGVGALTLNSGPTNIAGPVVAGKGFKLITMLRRSGTLFAYVDDQLVGSIADTTNQTIVNATTMLGCYYQGGAPAGANSQCQLALWRVSATAPTADQIAHIYRTELPLFQPNAKCTLGMAAGTVTQMGYDDITDIAHLASNTVRSSFKDLLRVDTQVSGNVGAVSSLSAANGMLLTAGSSGARISKPAISLREAIRRQEDKATAIALESSFFEYDAITAQTAFVLPKRYTAKVVKVNGSLKRAGATKDYVVTSDGFQETVTFFVAPGAAAFVSIQATRT